MWNKKGSQTLDMNKQLQAALILSLLSVFKAEQQAADESLTAL